MSISYAEAMPPAWSLVTFSRSHGRKCRLGVGGEMQAEGGRWVGRCGQKWVHYKGKGKLGAPQLSDAGWDSGGEVATQAVR